MADFMRHQESLFELRSNILMNDERNLTVEGGARAIEYCSTRGTCFHGNAELICDSNRELIGAPQVAPTFNCFVV
jgi:hypothetical protein